MRNRKKRRKQKQAIEVDARGIPKDVSNRAMAFAMRFWKNCRCPDCEGICRCGAYLNNLWQIMNRYLCNWECKTRRELADKITMKEREKRALQAFVERGVDPDLIQVEESFQRLRPGQRLPERNGFEIDHDPVLGERWRRFNQPHDQDEVWRRFFKSMKTKRK